MSSKKSLVLSGELGQTWLVKIYVGPEHALAGREQVLNWKYIAWLAIPTICIEDLLWGRGQFNWVGLRTGKVALVSIRAFSSL